MSGTSIDGVDASLIFTNGQKIKSKGGFISIPYKSSEQKAIKAALGIDARTASNLQMEILEDAKKAVTKRHIEAISALIKKENIKHLDAIGFHGHTIIHKPQEQYTLQIGSAQEIANKFNIKVIADMRLDDIKNKGQGAPLIPIYHKILYKDKPKPTAVINIGGVANITYIDGNNLIAFDTGTGNALINDLINQKLNQKYDKDGKIAAKGAINYNILQKLLSAEYFNKMPPKSLDRDYFKKALCVVEKLNLNDAAATLTAFTAEAIKKAFFLLPAKPKEVIICGGGAKNCFLMKYLRSIVDIPIIISRNYNRIEADGFALLAARKIYNLPSTFKSTTGVENNECICGKIYTPNSL